MGRGSSRDNCGNIWCLVPGSVAEPEVRLCSKEVVRPPASRPSKASQSETETDSKVPTVAEAESDSDSVF